MKRFIVIAAVLSTFAACSSDDRAGVDSQPAGDTATSAGDTATSAGDTATSAGPTPSADELAVPEDMCAVMAVDDVSALLGVEFDDAAPWSFSTDRGCDYFTSERADAPSQSVSFGYSPDGAVFGGPAEVGDAIIADLEADEFVESARSEPVSGLGDDAVFVVGVDTDGGSSQWMIWQIGPHAFELVWDDLGPDGNTVERLTELEALARALLDRMGG